MKAVLGWLGVAVLAATGGAARGEVVAWARSPGGEFGEFRVVLDVEKAPRAVANFMGLVDGSRAWIDPDTKGVRGGAGDAFYDGMVFDMHMGSVVRGGLREMDRDGIVEHSGGPGYALQSETGESGWREVEEGSLVLVERMLTGDGVLSHYFTGYFGDVFEMDVRHSGGAELGLFLTNGVVPWTVFGQVPEEDLAGLRELSAAVEQGATEVRWEVDASGMTEAERTALEAARAELPVVRGIRAKATTNGVEWAWSGKSRLWFSLATNLLAGWHHLDTWNEAREASDVRQPWGSLGWPEEGGGYVTLDGPQGFAAFAEAEHPSLAGTPLAGKWTIGTAQTGQDMQFWLDFSGHTGYWGKVEGGAVTSVGTVSEVHCERETANSLCVMFFLGTSIRYYWFGVEEDGAARGLFQSVQVEVMSGECMADNGAFVWVAGWGEEGEKARSKAVGTLTSPPPGFAGSPLGEGALLALPKAVGTVASPPPNLRLGAPSGRGPLLAVSEAGGIFGASPSGLQPGAPSGSGSVRRGNLCSFSR